MSTIPFGRQLEQGDRGSDVKAVKRALARAGFGPKRFAGITRLFGPFAAKNLKRFQLSRHISADGVYGPNTHDKLSPYFDSLAVKLYAERHAAGFLQLPETFHADHETSGLPGFPAIDVFDPGGTLVGSPADGWISRHSGHATTPTTRPGGPYGWSIYLETPAGDVYFLTHFGERYTVVGQHVKKGEVLGTIADYAAATGGVTPSHIHEGLHQARS